ncbi:hypothetical protein JXB02_00190 [Candidatus Woesearchaeota archaeon]|nr:hypothetical protein [Candidatus Woesearchaeota archaeon]
MKKAVLLIIILMLTLLLLAIFFIFLPYTTSLPNTNIELTNTSVLP